MATFTDGLLAARAAVEGVEAQLADDYWTAEAAGAVYALEAIDRLIAQPAPTDGSQA